MADKEATVYVVDVGRTMGRRRHGRANTDLEWAMTWIWDKMTSVVATERKTLLQGVVALNTDGTGHDMQDDESYRHLTIMQEPTQILLSHLVDLRAGIKPSNTSHGDPISALVLAISMIDRTCKKLKYRRRIMLITDGESRMDVSSLEEINKKIVQDGIEITVLGVDFDDEGYGFKEEDKSPTKRKNEIILKQFVEDCNGAYGTLAQAIDELGEPRIKETRPVPSYRGLLTLGDPVAYPDSTICIDVERYPRTMIRRPQTASSFVTLREGAQSLPSTDTVMGDALGNSDQADGELTQVRNQISYFVEDSEAPNGKLRVERDDLARGYEYGRTAVHISEVDEGVTKLETKIGLQILGFIPWENYERFMSMSNTHVVVPSRSNSKAVMALSSFVHALHELESFAVARLVTKDGKEPTIEVLAPSIEPDFECLVNVNLPFAEDVRMYKFPPLDRVVTVSGKVLKEHRFLPNDNLMAAMDEYVDSMDLSNFGQDDDGNEAEYLNITDAFSPVLHHIDQAVRWRAVHPNGEVPKPYESLTRFREPPAALLEDNKKSLAKLAAAADVKKVPPKFVGRKRKGETKKPVSGLDVDALLDGGGGAGAGAGASGGRGRRAVDPTNPIPSLKQMLDQADSADTIGEAARQMSAVIRARVENSYGDASYDQAVEEMRAFRDEMYEMEEPALWNDFIRDFKEKVFVGALGEGREEFWFNVRRARLGLHTGKFPGGGEVSHDEATEFLRFGGS